MQENYLTYSIIIPHYNAGNLLKRALNSIPIRQDIEIIVVDDVSDQTEIRYISDSTEFRHVDFVFSNNKLNAGGARNLGLTKARGNNILFLDSDDYFLDDSFSVFDEYSNSGYDLVHFEATSFIEGTQTTGNRHLYLEEIYKMNGLTRYISINQPYCKLLSKHFLDFHNIKFSEAIMGDDIVFSAKVALYSEKKAFVNTKVYAVSENQNSIMSTPTPEKMCAFIDEQTKRLKLVISNTSPLFWWPYFARRNMLPIVSNYLNDTSTSKDLMGSSQQYVSAMPRSIYCLYKLLKPLKSYLNKV